MIHQSWVQAATDMVPVDEIIRHAEVFCVHGFKRFTYFSQLSGCSLHRDGYCSTMNLNCQHGCFKDQWSKLQLQSYHFIRLYPKSMVAFSWEKHKYPTIISYQLYTTRSNCIICYDIVDIFSMTWHANLYTSANPVGFLTSHHVIVRPLSRSTSWGGGADRGTFQRIWSSYSCSIISLEWWQKVIGDEDLYICKFACGNMEIEGEMMIEARSVMGLYWL